MPHLSLYLTHLKLYWWGTEKKKKKVLLESPGRLFPKINVLFWRLRFVCPCGHGFPLKMTATLKSVFYLPQILDKK